MDMRSMIGSGTVILALGFLLLSLAPYLSGFWWVLELPSHFRVHIGVASTALVIVGLIGRSWPAVALAAGAAIVCWFIVLSVPRAQYLDGAGVTVVSQNLSWSNSRVEDALRVLAEQDADLLVLQEYTPEWHDALAALAKGYPYTIIVPRKGAFGIAVYSKIPVASHEVHRLGDSRTPFLEIRLDSTEFEACLIAVHFQPPMQRQRAKDRNRQLADLQQYLGTIDGPFVIVGDFNNTPYSPVLQSFMRQTGTGVSRAISRPSWPSLLGVFGIPIDLAIGSSQIRIGAVSAIEPVGSDHRGLRFSISGK